MLGTNRPSPFGGLFPFEPARVRLVSEEVVIRAEGDGTHYQVEARYRLDRLAEATKVTFGVPINGTGDDGLARTVRVAVDGGREVGCARAAGAAGGGTLSPPAWCAATVALSPGLHALVLRYRGELVYEDGDFAGGAHVTARHLVHPLSTAGYWTGLPGRVRVKLDLARVPGVAVTAKPNPAKTSPRLLEWSFVPKGEAARQVKEARLSLALRWQFRPRDFADGRPQRSEVAVRASSVLEPSAEHAPEMSPTPTRSPPGARSRRAATEDRGRAPVATGRERPAALRHRERRRPPRTGRADELPRPRTAPGEDRARRAVTIGRSSRRG